MEQQNQKLHLGKRSDMDSATFASCLFWATIISQLLFFYTDIFGLTGKVAGIMFFDRGYWMPFYLRIMGVTADRDRGRGQIPALFVMGSRAACCCRCDDVSNACIRRTKKLIYAYATFYSFLCFYIRPSTSPIRPCWGHGELRRKKQALRPLNSRAPYLGGLKCRRPFVRCQLFLVMIASAKGWQ